VLQDSFPASLSDFALPGFMFVACTLKLGERQMTLHLQFENNIEGTAGSVYNYHIRTKRGGFIFPSYLKKSERIFANILSGLNGAVKPLYLR
jgi:hypothetical protein